MNQPAQVVNGIPEFDAVIYVHTESLCASPISEIADKEIATAQSGANFIDISEAPVSGSATARADASTTTVGSRPGQFTLPEVTITSLHVSPKESATAVQLKLILFGNYAVLYLSTNRGFGTVLLCSPGRTERARVEMDVLMGNRECDSLILWARYVAQPVMYKTGRQVMMSLALSPEIIASPQAVRDAAASIQRIMDTLHWKEFYQASDDTTPPTGDVTFHH